MVINKKILTTAYEHSKEHGAKIYGSLIERKLKRNIIYKIYFEMINKTEFSDKPAYIKLIFPSKTEIIISPLTELEKAIEPGKGVGIAKYEFEEEFNGIKYLYLCKVGGLYFDLPEKMAKEMAKIFDFKIKDCT